MPEQAAAETPQQGKGKPKRKGRGLVIVAVLFLALVVGFLVYAHRKNQQLAQQDQQLNNSYAAPSGYLQPTGMQPISLGGSGTPGPAGPTGPVGVTGDAGKTGAQGKQGKPGTTTVKSHHHHKSGIPVKSTGGEAED